ncbi:MAG: peptidase M75 [Bacteroidales bacterium]|nr:peptidase M75 [Bacteroidales bacterium]
MKKKLRNLMLIAAAMTCTVAFTSCKDDDDDKSVNNDSAEAEYKMLAEQYVNNTVVYTYKQLAAQTEQLATQLATLQESKTQANLEQVCTTFLEAREWWEKSEAFLFGPATSFGIDPHIDSWPLDATRFDALMSNANQLEQLGGEDGDLVANGLEATLLGFHGLEYVLFADGAAKQVSAITDNQLIYAVAVAGDLRNCCYRLAISWAGEDNVPTHYVEKMEEAEWEYTVNGNGRSYADDMMRAGKAGSTYESFAHVMQQIATGCADIADEVGTSKVGSAYKGEDETYIESPYSKKSLIDFRDNMLSIQNAYMGGVEGQRDESKSIHNYVKNHNAALDQEIMTALDNAINEFETKAAQGAFVDTYMNAGAYDDAMQYCSDLEEAMIKLRTFFGGAEE